MKLITFVAAVGITIAIGLNAVSNKSIEEIPEPEFQVEYVREVPVVYVNDDLEKILHDFHTKERPKINYGFKDKELFYLAATMWGEARSEGKRGMAMVGHVVMNRKHVQYRGGDSIKEIVLQPYQFSCWNKKDPNRKYLNRNYLESLSGEDRERWEQAKELARHIYNGSRDYTGGALHYHTKQVKPFWQSAYDVTLKAGNHIFYR